MTEETTSPHTFSIKSNYRVSKPKKLTRKQWDQWKNVQREVGVSKLKINLQLNSTDQAKKNRGIRSRHQASLQEQVRAFRLQKGNHPRCLSKIFFFLFEIGRRAVQHIALEPATETEQTFGKLSISTVITTIVKLLEEERSQQVFHRNEKFRCNREVRVDRDGSIVLQRPRRGSIRRECSRRRGGIGRVFKRGRRYANK